MPQRRILGLLICASIGACTEGGATGVGGSGGARVESTTSSAVTASSSSSASTSSATASSSGATSSTSSGAPDFDSIPWTANDAVGFGIAMKDTENPRGNNVFIGDAGYAIALDDAKAWVRELYLTRLEALGVRWVYAVQGPNDVVYANYEIGNTHIAAALQDEVTPETAFIAIAAHSSGAYVAHELLNQLATGYDPSGITDQKVVYLDLDGAQGGLNAASVGRLRHAWFVAARDTSTGTDSPNKGSMLGGANTYPSKGTYAELDVADAGCNPGAVWCVHMTLVTTKPHDPADASGPADYSDFVGRPVSAGWLDLAALP